MALKFIDDRDNEEYNLIRIGNQLWFAENFRHRVDDRSFFYKDDYRSFKKNGYLYSKDALEELCPPGWHIPSTAEFTKLFQSLEDSAKAMNWVEMFASKHLDRNLSLQFGGFGSEVQMDFWDEGQGAYFWTSTEGKNKDKQYCVIDSKGISFRYPAPMRDLFSVRLVCNEVLTTRSNFAYLKRTTSNEGPF